MNPSPTGHYQGNHNRCTPEQTLRYLNRLSGPFLDRFDLSLKIPLPPPGILSQNQVKGEDSATVKQRVMAARDRQYRRQNKLNAHLVAVRISINTVHCAVTMHSGLKKRSRISDYPSAHGYA